MHPDNRAISNCMQWCHLRYVSSFHTELFYQGPMREIVRNVDSTGLWRRSPKYNMGTWWSPTCWWRCAMTMPSQPCFWEMLWYVLIFLLPFNSRHLRFNMCHVMIKGEIALFWSSRARREKSPTCSLWAGRTMAFPTRQLAFCLSCSTSEKSRRKRCWSCHVIGASVLLVRPSWSTAVLESDALVRLL